MLEDGHVALPPYVHESLPVQGWEEGGMTAKGAGEGKGRRATLHTRVVLHQIPTLSSCHTADNVVVSRKQSHSHLHLKSI